MKADVKHLNKPVPSFLKACLDAGLVGAFEGPGDLAKNHSQYLRGLKQWKPKRAKKKAAA